MIKKIFNPLRSLYFTQFLSAFADNAIFFTILAIVAQQGIANPESHMTTVQAAFLIAYVILAPIVGALADKNAKKHILLIGNLIKGFGVVALFAGLNPALSYFIIGVGAVIYSPAKYGILPDLTKTEDELLKANAKMEGYTIFAILTGGIAGGFLGSYSTEFGLLVCGVLYLVSLLMTFLIPKVAGDSSINYVSSIKNFFKDFKILWTNPKLNFSLIGTGSFWFASSVLRLAFLIFIASILGITDTFQQSLIVGASAIGVVIGSLLTPRLIPTGKYKRTYYYGIALMFIILFSAFVPNLPLVLIVLFLIGFLEGVYVVPMNTILQDEGKKLIGAGKTIAIQNFVNNIFMLVGIGAFKVAIAQGIPIQFAIVGVGVVLGFLLLLIRKKIKTL